MRARPIASPVPASLARAFVMFVTPFFPKRAPALRRRLSDALGAKGCRISIFSGGLSCLPARLARLQVPPIRAARAENVAPGGKRRRGRKAESVILVNGLFTT